MLLYTARVDSPPVRPAMTAGESARDQLDAVIAHLAARRETLLQHWREAADADPEPDPMHFFPPEHNA